MPRAAAVTAISDDDGRPLIAAINAALPRSGKLSLRPVEPGDSDFLRGMVIADADLVLGQDVPRSVRLVLHTLQVEGRRHFAAGSHPGLLDLLIVGGRGPVGRLAIVRGENRIDVVDFMIHPTSRGRGLGRGVIDALCAAAAAGGLGVATRIWYRNPASRLFLRAGFVALADNASDPCYRWAG